MSVVAAFMGSGVSKVSKAVHAATSIPSSVEKNSCRAIIQQALALEWEDSHHDLAKALAIDRDRLSEAQRAYERTCEAAVEGVR